jgi:hypothetical protein
MARNLDIDGKLLELLSTCIAALSTPNNPSTMIHFLVRLSTAGVSCTIGLCMVPMKFDSHRHALGSEAVELSCCSVRTHSSTAAYKKKISTGSLLHSDKYIRQYG